MLESFRATYEETPKKRDIVGSYSKPAFTTSTEQQEIEVVDFKDRQVCPCGAPHLATRCWYFNKSLRPYGWKEAPHRQAKIQKAFEREPDWEAWIKGHMIEEYMEEEYMDEHIEQREYAPTTNPHGF